MSTPDKPCGVILVRDYTVHVYLPAGVEIPFLLAEVNPHLDISVAFLDVEPMERLDKIVSACVQDVIDKAERGEIDFRTDAHMDTQAF